LKLNLLIGAIRQTYRTKEYAVSKRYLAKSDKFACVDPPLSFLPASAA